MMSRRLVFSGITTRHAADGFNAMAGAYYAKPRNISRLLGDGEMHRRTISIATASMAARRTWSPRRFTHSSRRGNSRRKPATVEARYCASIAIHPFLLAAHALIAA